MSGRRKRKERIKRWLFRRKFIFLLFITGSILPALVSYAVYDFVTSAKQKEDAVRNAVLRSELAQFALNLKDDDGYTVLENPDTLGATSRALTPVLMRRSFFTYFLNRANAKSFDSGTFNWDMPNVCVVEFPIPSSTKTPGVIGHVARACIAIVPNEAIGRYIYVTLRYPTAPITRHVQGKPISAADHVELEFLSDRTQKFQLVFEPVTLAAERYPSQKHRFSTLHAVTAYPIGESGHPIRAVNGQAYERQVDDGAGHKINWVTVLVRIDASLLTAMPATSLVGSGEHRLSTAIRAARPATANAIDRTAFEIKHGQTGIGLISLERLYKLYVSSKSGMEIRRTASQAVPIWKSNFEVDTRTDTHAGWIQSVSNRWAAFIGRVFGFSPKQATAEQAIPSQGITVSLTERNAGLPEIATRAFLFLSMTLLIVVLLTVSGVVVIYQFGKISKIAYAITTSRTPKASLAEYRKRTDEIGAFGRIFDLLIRKNQAKNARWVARTERDAKEQKEQARIEFEQAKTRNAILDAIGHEIRSPLNNLMSKADSNAETNRDLQRMTRAVEALYFANTIEAGLKNGKYSLVPADIAFFLSQYASNMAEQIDNLHYVGPTSNVIVALDDVLLNQVMDHLYDNAVRHRYPNAVIRISLIEIEENVQIELFNEGPNIPHDQTDSIFDLGVSSEEEQRNMGLGLFAARIYVAAMKGAISAVNRENGVSFIIDLPKI